MNNTISITVRAFPVHITDERTGAELVDTIVLTRQQLQAAQLVEESSKELIHRIFNRRGYRVTYIGAPTKKTINVDLYLDQNAGIVVEGFAEVDQGAVR